MRIAHLSIGSLPPVFSAFGGAVQRWVAELACEQVRRGHSVTVFSPGLTNASTRVKGVNLTHVRCRVSQPWAHIEFQLRALSRLMRSADKPEIIHFHSEPEGAVLSRWFAATRVLSYNNFYFRGGRQRPFYRVYRHLIQEFDALLPCSEYCRSASAEYWRLPLSRLQVSPCGVDVGTFCPNAENGQAERAALGVAGSVILYVGRISKQKGTDTLLAAYAWIRARNPNTTLVLAGPSEQFDGHDSGAARVWQEAIASAGAVHLGAVSDERLPRLYNAADVF